MGWIILRGFRKPKNRAVRGSVVAGMRRTATGGVDRHLPEP